MANANWEHAHLYMDDAGTVVARSDLSSQDVDLTAGGGGTPSLAAVLAEDGDPDGNPITGAVNINVEGVPSPFTIDSDATTDSSTLLRARNADTNGLFVYGSGAIFVEADSATKPALYAAQDGAALHFKAGYNSELTVGEDKLGFFGKTAVTKPVVPLTTPNVQNVIDALVALGLVSQSD